MSISLWWIRRDLRLRDNQALSQALARSRVIVPLFILDPALQASPYVGEKQLAFLLDGLRALDTDLRARGSQLFVRLGPPMQVLTQILQGSGATAIFAEADVSPYARQRDARIAAQLPLHLTGGLTVHPADAVLKKDGTPYRIFTPFSRTWHALPVPTLDDIIPAPCFIPTLNTLETHPLPDAPATPITEHFIAGKAEARHCLHAFIHDHLEHYAEQRDRMDLVGTSQLSPYLRFGMLSAREVVATALTSTHASATTWLNELIWREFYISILYHFPEVRQHSFRENLRSVAWRNDPADFAAWCEGRTGYPIVDAAMHQLRATGWMHNRARMIVAAFLTKHLLIDWRWGERFFMRHLIDGDPAANNGGWQWSAGTGTDAAPYFRIFNPTRQGQRHDPQGDYIRRWLPQLANVPKRYIHTPWDMPDDVQRTAKCHIGDYPTPIVNHKLARERAMTAYKSARKSTTS